MHSEEKPDTPYAPESTADSLPLDIAQILVIDSDEASRAALLDHLSSPDYILFDVAEVEQAVKILTEISSVELVLLNASGNVDLQPAINGLWAASPGPYLSIISLVDDPQAAHQALEHGVDDVFLRPVDGLLLRHRLHQNVERIALRRRNDNLLNHIIPIGVSLSAEKDFNRLLEVILIEAQTLSNADGGTLYLGEGDVLKFVIMRNKSLDIRQGGTTGEPIQLGPLPLHTPDGKPNLHNVATYTAITGETVNIVDAYETDKFDFSGTRTFDQKVGYRSQSFLCVPLRDAVGEVIGVLQLINALHSETDNIKAFNADLEPLIESLASMAAVALQAYIREEQLRQKIEELRIEIDESRKQRQVSEIVESTYFKDLRDRAKELRATRRDE